MNIIQQIVDLIDEQQLWEKTIQLDRNEYLKTGGSTDTRLFYVEDGALRLFQISEYEEHTMRLGYSSNLIAALDSFITQQPSPLYIQALRKTRLRVISRAAYLALMQANETNTKLWNTTLQVMLLDQMEREQDLLIASPVERYRRVLARSPQLFQEIPNKHIAAYLRMTPETLSRIKKS